MENQDNLQKITFTREQKEKFISDWKRSGKSKIKFAGENGLKYYTFVSWFESQAKKKLLSLKKSGFPLSLGGFYINEVADIEATTFLWRLKK